MKVNALILDDNPIVGQCIKKRVFKANSCNRKFSQLEVIPFFTKYSLKNIDEIIRSIEFQIISDNINALLIDRGWYELINPNENKSIPNLDKEHLYLRKEDSGIKIEEILSKIDKSKFKNIKVVIIYTYDSDNWFIEPAELKKIISNVLPNGFDINFIDVILTNTEIYKLAKLQLYNSDNPITDGKLIKSGRIADFKLYGLFMGEILYHRIVSHFKGRQSIKTAQKKQILFRNIILLFIVFTSLGLGGEAIYNLISNKINNDFVIIALSFVFALLFPLMILLLKPEWILDYSDKE